MTRVDLRKMMIREYILGDFMEIRHHCKYTYETLKAMMNKYHSIPLGIVGRFNPMYVVAMMIIITTCVWGAAAVYVFIYGAQETFVTIFVFGVVFLCIYEFVITPVIALMYMKMRAIGYANCLGATNLVGAALRASFILGGDTGVDLDRVKKSLYSSVAVLDSGVRLDHQTLWLVSQQLNKSFRDRDIEMFEEAFSSACITHQ